MAITVASRPPVENFSINCTDQGCRAVLHFTSDDVDYNTRGLSGDRVKGIVCPLCNEVLELKNATRLRRGE